MNTASLAAHPPRRATRAAAALVEWLRDAWQHRPDGRPRMRRYVLAALLGSLAIWTLALSVVVLWPRQWTVTSSLILPGSDNDARIDLKEVGQAYATPRSTYDSKSLDPRVNYKQILLSPNVLEAAAATLDIEPERVGEPRIKLIDQSSVVELRVSASTAELALAKSQALHVAFQDRLTQLRRDEVLQRERAIEQAIEASRRKLETARTELTALKVGSQIVTDQQLGEMALAITSLERRHIELGQQLSRERGRTSSLVQQLGVSALAAGRTLTLQGDAVFGEHHKQFAAASALVAERGYKWDEQHPKLREARGVADAAFAAMVARAREVLGVPLGAQALREMAIVLQDRSREQLLRDLVSAQTSADAASAELAKIAQQQTRLQARLPALARQASDLDNLQRRLQFSEAVFTNVVGKTDVGGSNVFSSYPMVQTLVAPTLPKRPTSPRASFIAAGALAGSLLLTIGLSLAWLRQRR